MSKPDEKVEIENINTPGRASRKDKAKYTAMRSALLRVMPKESLLQRLPEA